MAEMDENLMLTPKEMKKFGRFTYNHSNYFKYDSNFNKYWDLDLKNNGDTLKMVVSKHDCGCEVVTYHNCRRRLDQRSDGSHERIIKNKIIKANNCTKHQKIVDKRNKLLQKLKELEDGNIEFIPRVVRTLNKKCISDSREFIPKQDIISQTIELNDFPTDDEEYEEDEDEKEAKKEAKKKAKKEEEKFWEEYLMNMII
jgi:hypothetical protein